jgi:hypothetical protein
MQLVYIDKVFVARACGGHQRENKGIFPRELFIISAGCRQ